jgi:hypothetical protein
MFRLLTATCPVCKNAVHVETAGDGPPSTQQWQCPRCYGVFTVRSDEGMPQSRPTPWAIRATDPPPDTNPPADPGNPPAEPFPLPAPPGLDVPTTW